jgi:site-specific DNA-methyltransferase (adenine-specific)
LELNKVICDDCIEAMKKIPDNSIDSCVSDPPYGLSKEPDIKEVLTHWINDDEYEHGGSGFMGRSWDSFVPGPKYWKELFRILKPGAHALIFSGTRTYDLLVIALRMAGFEIRDQMQWIFGSGFPKSMNVGKAIYKVKGKDAKKWFGWGTQLKPANEPICLVRKPLLRKNIVENVLDMGTGSINIDECRIPVNPDVDDMLRKTDRGKRKTVTWEKGSGFKNENNDLTGVRPEGRWPTNILLQHHPDCKHIGLKEVKGHKGYPKGPGGIWKNDYQKEHQDATGMTQTSTKKDNEAWEGHANKNGNEIIEDWDCHPDCPIKILNYQSGFLQSGENCTRTMEGTFLEHGGLGGAGDVQTTHGDSGGAARFFYCGKASKAEKNKGCENLPEKTIGHNRFDKCGECGGYILQNPTRPSACKCENPVRVHNTVQGNTHPTVKPLKLCRYLINLITPKDGIVIDPFAGSGSILVAAKQLEFKFIGIDKDEEYCEIAKCRLGAEFNGDIDDSYSMVRVIRRPNDKSMEQKTFFELE